MRQRQHVLLAAVLLGMLAACAPRVAPVAAPSVPRYPEFVFPAPDVAAAERTLEDHQAAWNLLQSGDPRSAERRYAALLKRSAAFYPAAAGMGYAALARADFDDAVEHFNRALSSNASYAPALAGRGQTYLAMGQRARALASFDAALAADPGLATIRNAADVLRVEALQGGVAGARKAAQEGRLAEARAGYQHAILASPQSPFLHRELAQIEFRAGDLPAALARVQKAIDLDSAEPRSFVLLGDILEGMGEFEKAADALARAAALEPSDELTDRIDALRATLSFAAMPEAYRTIEEQSSITRAQLAALIAVRGEVLVKRAPRRSAAVITDIRGNWAQHWILAVSRAGFMEVYPNYTFQPNVPVRRSDLAFTASRILSFIATENPRLGAGWRNPQRRFPDIPSGHLSHPAAAVSVEAGVIATLENGTFQLARPVSGAEAIAAVERLLALAGPPR